MTRRLVVDVKGLSRMEADRLRERLGRMLSSLEDADPRHPVDIDQTSPTTPIHADMRGFGLHLQVHPGAGRAEISLKSFLVRALHSDTAWTDATSYEPVRAAVQGAWETVRALVGDLIDANLAERGLFSAPLCAADACLGPRMRHVHPSLSEIVQSAVDHAFLDVPDVAWTYSITTGRRMRDFRIGDHTIAFSEVAMPDPITRLRALSSWSRAHEVLERA